VRLKFAETQYDGANQRIITIYINGQKVAEGLDVWATAGGANRAVDLVYNDIRPQNGVVALRFVGSRVDGCQRDAMLQALEIGPGDGGQGSSPKTIGSGSPRDNSGKTQVIYVQAVRYKNSVTPERAQLLLQSLKNTFRTIPEVKSVEVGSVVEDNQKEYDYAVVMRFNNLEEKRAYGNSEVHRRWVHDNNVGDAIDKHLMLTIQSDSPGQ
jgi:hypothetical protein